MTAPANVMLIWSMLDCWSCLRPICTVRSLLVLGDEQWPEVLVPRGEEREHVSAATAGRASGTATRHRNRQCP